MKLTSVIVATASEFVAGTVEQGVRFGASFESARLHAVGPMGNDVVCDRHEKMRDQTRPQRTIVQEHQQRDGGADAMQCPRKAETVKNLSMLVSGSPEPDIRRPKMTADQIRSLQPALAALLLRFRGCFKTQKTFGHWEKYLLGLDSAVILA